MWTAAEHSANESGGSENGTNMSFNSFSRNITPDWEALVRCIQRKGTPARVHYIELFLDGEVQTAICGHYGLLDGMDSKDPFFDLKRQVKVQRFLGYDYVRCGLEGIGLKIGHTSIEDTAGLKRDGGRSFIDENRGPITNWAEFNAYPWPDPEKAGTRALEWYQKNLPDDMCIIGSGGFAHFCEYLTWLMGYQTLCYALFDDRDMVKAISQKLIDLFRVFLRRMLEFDRVKMIWGSDDMGFRSGTLISPDDLREFVFPGHKLMADMAHAAGCPYLLHSCGQLAAVEADLIENVGIDGQHSFEDTIIGVADFKKQYGNRIAVLGGMDVDFLCRAGRDEVERRVESTLEKCMPNGGYCLGTGNSVANYIPLDNYLTMLETGRRFKP